MGSDFDRLLGPGPAPQLPVSSNSHFSLPRLSELDAYSRTQPPPAAPASASIRPYSRSSPPRDVPGPGLPGPLTPPATSSRYTAQRTGWTAINCPPNPRYLRPLSSSPTVAECVNSAPEPRRDSFLNRALPSQSQAAEPQRYPSATPPAHSLPSPCSAPKQRSRPSTTPSPEAAAPHAVEVRVGRKPRGCHSPESLAPPPPLVPVSGLPKIAPASTARPHDAPAPVAAPEPEEQTPGPRSEVPVLPKFRTRGYPRRMVRFLQNHPTQYSHSQPPVNRGSVGPVKEVMDTSSRVLRRTEMGHPVGFVPISMDGTEREPTNGVGRQADVTTTAPPRDVSTSNAAEQDQTSPSLRIQSRCGSTYEGPNQRAGEAETLTLAEIKERLERHNKTFDELMEDIKNRDPGEWDKESTDTLCPNCEQRPPTNTSEPQNGHRSEAVSQGSKRKSPSTHGSESEGPQKSRKVNSAKSSLVASQPNPPPAASSVTPK